MPKRKQPPLPLLREAFEAWALVNGNDHLRVARTLAGVPLMYRTEPRGLRRGDKAVRVRVIVEELHDDETA